MRIAGSTRTRDPYPGELSSTDSWSFSVSAKARRRNELLSVQGVRRGAPDFECHSSPDREDAGSQPLFEEGIAIFPSSGPGTPVQPTAEAAQRFRTPINVTVETRPSKVPYLAPLPVAPA